MCDPITAASAALQAGGMAANSIGASAAASARQRALENSIWGQMANQQSAFNQVDQGRAKYENFTPGMEKRTGEIGDFVNSVANAPALNTMAPTTSAATQDAMGAAAAKTASTVAQHGRAMAENLGFGDYLHSTNLGAQRNIETAGMFNDFAKGLAGLLPGQLDRASHAGDTLMGLGGIAGALGRLGVGYGIQRMYSPLAASIGATQAPLAATTPTGLAPIY